MIKYFCVFLLRASTKIDLGEETNNKENEIKNILI